MYDKYVLNICPQISIQSLDLILHTYPSISPALPSSYPSVKAKMKLFIVRHCHTNVNIYVL